MSTDKDIYQKIHSYCFENEAILNQYHDCGCLYCGKKMASSDIEEWIEDKNGKTALCPFCNVDSVVPLKIDNVYELTNTMIEEMYKRYF